MPIATSLREGASAAGRRPSAPDESRTEVIANDDGQVPWGSFHLATVMFHRARQLRDGSPPRVEASGHKALRIAFLEVTAGTIPWEIGARIAPHDEAAAAR